METLYDLLGALPEDDADSLRAAFRHAVKSTHPDINPGDPHAALKFRKLVRASEILFDHEQRAAYDHLLDLADVERNDRPKRVADTMIYQLATGVMTLAVVSLVLLVGYMLFGYVNNIPLGPAQATDTSRAEPAKMVALTELVDTPERTSDKAVVDGDKKFEDFRTIEEPSAPAAGAAVADASSTYKDESILPAHDFAAPDFEPANANDYREQAISAYRNGDLYLALIKLDLAISLDPKSSDAYVDRSIVLHRMGDTKRAYADIAKAKRIDDLNRR
jgi:tetratricopeptide (TPR) repeat protein